MRVNKIKLANKKYRHELKRRQKRHADKIKSLKLQEKLNKEKRQRKQVDAYVDDLKKGLEYETADRNDN